MNKRAKAYSRAFKQKHTVTQQLYRRITGEDSPKEYDAYKRGFEGGIDAAMRYVHKWEGNTNSELGELLKRKFEELKNNI